MSEKGGAVPTEELRRLLDLLPKEEWRAGRSDMTSYEPGGGPFKNVYTDDPDGKMHLGYPLPLVIARGEGQFCHEVAQFIELAKAALPALLDTADRAQLLEKALHQVLEGNHDVDFVIEWEAVNEEPRRADPGHVVAQCGDLYGAQFHAPELAELLKTRAGMPIEGQE